MIMFNYKIIINFCYGCDIIITSKTKRDRIEPFLIEINDKSKLIYTRILILITWMDDACSFFIFIFFQEEFSSILQNFSNYSRANV